jgi:hypothetical protein
MGELLLCDYEKHPHTWLRYVATETLHINNPYLSLYRKLIGMKTFLTAVVFLVSTLTGFAQANDPFLVFPIELKFFQVQKTSQHNVLRWFAPCTSDFAVFEVQHSTDSKNFTVLHSFTADQIRCAQPFDYTDLQRREGINYYRIKLTTPANTTVNSFTVAVLNGNKGFELNALLPSLVTTTASLSISSATKDRLVITITDLKGQQFLLQQQELQPGTNQLQLNLLSLPAGQYFIKAMNGSNETRQLRFLKQ